MSHKQQTILIATPTEFCFAENLAYLAREQNEVMYEVIDQSIIRAIKVNHQPILIQLDAPNQQEIHCTFITHQPSEIEQQEVIAYVTEWFDLERDLQPFYTLAQHDALLSIPYTKFYGLRNIGIPDFFEALVWGILGQQINLRFAYTLKRRFVEMYGECIVYEGKKYWLFPEPEILANVTVEELMLLKMTQKKSEYILDVAQKMVAGDLSKEKYLAMEDLQAVEKSLTAIRGIGPWTANYLAMRCLRIQTAFPVADVGLINAIKFLKEMDQKPTKEEILELAQNWENWQAYATFYLWRVLY